VRSASLRHVGHAFPRVSMKFLAGCSCVCAVALAFLSVGGVIEARSTFPAGTGLPSIADSSVGRFFPARSYVIMSFITYSLQVGALPRRIFLDSCTVQMLRDYDGHIVVCDLWRLFFEVPPPSLFLRFRLAPWS
jgi:hypothetical protein